MHYPHVEFADALPVDGSPYADHIPDEPVTFRFVEAYGVAAAVALIALLRDRYFPKLFPLFAPNHDSMSRDPSRASVAMEILPLHVAKQPRPLKKANRERLAGGFRLWRPRFAQDRALL